MLAARQASGRSCSTRHEHGLCVVGPNQSLAPKHRYLRTRFSLNSTSLRGTVPVVAHSQVSVLVEKTSWNSRKLFANVSVLAPVDVVWSCLTDYEGLGTFIPSLVENKCLERRADGALIYQVGAQEVAIGVKFSAACTLDCTEHGSGVPEALCSFSGDGSDGLFPHPKTCLPEAPCKDITFNLVDGDFKAFRGIWRLQPGLGSADCSTLLCYSLYVQPQAWLPVGIIQSRIKKEVLRNLDAVRKYAEKLHAQQ